VPGTALLSDLAVRRGHVAVVGAAAHLKHGTGRHAHVVLIPQPSDDPADPCVRLTLPRVRDRAAAGTERAVVQAQLAAVEERGVLLDAVRLPRSSPALAALTMPRPCAVAAVAAA
jgi:hypothetical protein